MKKIILSFFAAVLGLTGARLLSKNSKPKVYEYKVNSPKVPEAFDGLRIVQLSDTHCKRYGEDDRVLVEVCAELRPDIIVFTGDLYSRSCDMSYILSRLPLMEGLLRLAPVYYIRGNHEGDIPEKADVMDKRLSELGVIVLRNENTSYYRGDSHINIYGLELPPHYYRSSEGSYKTLPRLTPEGVKRRLGRKCDENLTILLAHNPLYFESFAEWGADIVFSGHVHGGMVRVFGVGLFSPERRFFPRYTKGLYREGDSQMIVSTGLGKFRINNPEMIALCVLKRKR